MKKTRLISYQILLTASSVALMAAATLCSAQSFPDKPIRIISPSPPGGGTDTATRLVTAKVTDLAKWQFVVETKPGAGGNVGLAYGMQQSADGYTLVMGETSNLTVNQYLYKSMPVDPEKETQPVALIGSGPLVFVISATKPYNTLAEVVAASKLKAMSIASSGSGTVGHLVSESFKKQSSAGGCAEFCVNGQSTAGESLLVRKHNDNQEARSTARTAGQPAGQLQEA